MGRTLLGWTPVGLLGALLFSAGAQWAPPQAPSPTTDWPAYGGGPAAIRFSPLAQINRSNVGRLKVAWTYDPGEGAGSTQAQPVVADGVLYTVTARHNAVALNAATGEPLWRFESGVSASGANRGVALWSSGGERRVFAAVRNFVYALTTP